MDVRIIGVNLPGRTWCDRQNIHVGIQRRAEVVERFPGDVAEAVWEFEVNVPDVDGGLDFRGPHVQGRRGERFVYLSWGTVDEEGTFHMFRRAKLMLQSIDGETVQAATRAGSRLAGTLALTMVDGGPLCAAVRPPRIQWAVVSEDRS